MTTDNNTAAPAETKQDRVSELANLVTDLLLENVSHAEVKILHENPAGIWTKFQSDLRQFTGNLVSAANAEQSTERPLQRAFGVEQVHPQDFSLGLLRTLGMSEDNPQ